MPNPRLSKSKLLASRQCPKRLWLEVHRPELKDESGTAPQFIAGQAVGAVARSLVPQGRLIAHDHDLDAALRDTEAALRSHPEQPLFEAAFRHGYLLVRADVLTNPGGAATLVEVKSTSGVKDYHYADAAIQAHVVKAAGVDLAQTCIAHVDTTWIYPGGERYDGLLVQVDVSDEIGPSVRDVPQWMAQAQSVAAAGQEPEVRMGEHCEKPFACPFMTYCASLAGPQPAYPVALLPGNDGKALARRLMAEGYTDLRDVPAIRVPASGKLARIHAVTRSGMVHRDAGARRAMTKWAFPRYWLDFETIAFAVPIWAGTRPYQQIPFQWSCQVEQGSGALDHEYFLDLSGADPRRACAERLLAVLGSRGAIVVYHAAFERGVLKGMAEAFPDLAPKLRALLDRVVDLEPVVRDHYYHRDMRGSYSIKKVLPTLAPHLAYESLGEVQSGDGAQAAYAEAIRPDTTPARRAEIERALLAYCRRDTEAMVAVARGVAA